MRIAYQGEPGAYSEQAVRRLFPDGEPMPCETVRIAFSRVTSGEADAAVVPVENSQAGTVNETYDLLGSSDLVRIVGEAVVRVDHALLAPPGARLEDVRRASSHWQALAQSEEFLARHGIEPVPVHDTAGAARMVAERGDPTEAAVASADIVRTLPLVVLAERIQTYPENFTRFVAIATQDLGLGTATKTSLVLAVKDRPGSLLASLQGFAEHDVNLVKLESRPRRGAPFEYLFHVDLEGTPDDPEVAAALEVARGHSSMFRVLGSYPAAPAVV